MSRNGFFFSVSLFTLATALTTTACSSGDVPVGTSDQALKKTPKGNPTGDGKTCSWDDTVSYDVATGQTTTTPSANGQYTVGQTFKSPDGCNDCTCTSQGITCTDKACGTPPGGNACPEIAKQCPDGSYVGPTGPNCEYACPDPIACTTEAKQCPDGSSVGRTGPKCEFAPCPGTAPGTCKKTGCSGEICSDQDIASNCIWHASYACYQTATCARQADGQCGFTATPALTQCLAANK